MREAEPPKRGSILEASQKPKEASQPLKESSQNHVSELPAASATPITQQQVEKTEEEGSGAKEKESETHRLSNGHVSPPPPAASHSPPSATLQDCRLSTLSNESNSSALSNGSAFRTEQERSSMGEESSMEVVGGSHTRGRHESAKSVSEETRELDELLNRSSVTSVLTDSQVGGASMDAKEFEHVGGASDEDLMRGGEEAGGMEDSSVSNTYQYSTLQCVYTRV